jgi:hypothetical protein
MNYQILNAIKHFALMFPSFIFANTFHNIAQATSAWVFGDDTAKDEGFITLNPLVHVDLPNLAIALVSLLVISMVLSPLIAIPAVILLLSAFGMRIWITVPFSSHFFKRERLGEIVTIMAGPLGFVFYAFIMLLLLRFLPFGSMSEPVKNAIQELASTAAQMGVFFAFLHLLPISPNCGGRLIKLMLPEPYGEEVSDWVAQYGLIAFILLITLPGLRELFLGMMHGGINLVLYVLHAMAFIGA